MSGGVKVKEKIRNFMKEKKLEKLFQRDNLIIIALSGILLLIIALPTGDTSGNLSKKETVVSEVRTQNEKQTVVLDDGYDESGQKELDTYEKTMEEKLKTILERMEGAGKVEVMITFASSQELVVEKDRRTGTSETRETDAQGGTRVLQQQDNDITTVYKQQGSDSTPYVVKTLTPKVEGVLVAAQGAGTSDVSRTITEAVQALFDLEIHKIKVIRMKN